MALPLILIVDDNPENLTVLGELLQPQHAVRVANSGLRALRLARLQPQPALILLDAMMPEMDGYEVLRQLRAQPETAAIPVVFLTALTDPADEQRGLLHGAAAYVTKPVAPALLLDLVRRQLQATARIGRLAGGLARQLRQPPAGPLPAGLEAGAPLAVLSQLASQVVGHLQEHWAGSGCPEGLAGAAIPLAARLWAVADACDRLASAGADQAALPPGRWLPALLAGASVLLAEDNLVNQEVAAELLRAAGLIVDLANNGAQAVSLARARAYDLILLDMQMPEVDGLEAARVIRKLPQHARTPILAMTANAFGDDRQACLDAGMDDHLSKPVHVEQLYAMLSHWLGAGRLAAPAGRAAASALAGDPPQPGQADAEPADAPAAARTPDLNPTPQPALSVPGLTMSRALMYLPGRDQVFERVLRQFASHYLSGIPGLSTALATGDWPEVRRLMHSFRGACGAIGATDLLARTGALEKTLEPLPPRAEDGAVERRDPTALAMQARQIDQAVVDLVSVILDRLGQAPAQPASPAHALDRSALRVAMDALAAQLRVADFAACAGFRALTPQLHAAFGAAAVQPAAAAMARHDYDGALLALHGLRHPTANAQLDP